MSLEKNGRRGLVTLDTLSALQGSQYTHALMYAKKPTPRL